MKTIKNEIFKDYFGWYFSPSVLAKTIKNGVNKKKFPKNENPAKIVNIVKIILDFSKQQKAEWLVLTPKQMLQRLPTAFQVKADNTPENLLNEIWQTIYSLYQAKEITKKLYDNIMNSIKVSDKMGTIFVNSENGSHSDLHRLLLNLSDKMNLKSSGKYCASSNLSIYDTLKI